MRFFSGDEDADGDTSRHATSHATASMSERTAVIPFDNRAPLEDLVGSFTWVTWLLQSVRARCERLHFHGGPLPGHRLRVRWERFGTERFLQHISGHLCDAWHAASRRELDSLVAIDALVERTLTPSAIARSRKAGDALLKTTRGARYQGVLGHYRAEVEAGTAHGHFIVVWAAVGHFFQLSLANVLAEYLRLEWTLGTREFATEEPPTGSFSLLASAALNRQMEEPSLLRRREG